MLMKRFKNFFKKLLGDQRGEAFLTLPYAIFLMIILLFVSIDGGGYMVTKWKLRTACSETLTLMKMENGFDLNIEAKFDEFLTKLGLNPSEVNVVATPKLVQRGDVINIKADYDYKLFCLKPLGQELTWPITVELSGLAQEFIR